MDSSKRETGNTRLPRLPSDLTFRFRVERLEGTNNTYSRYQVYDLKLYKPSTLTILGNVSNFNKSKIVRSQNILSRVDHPNILRVLEHGETNESGLYFWSTPREELIIWKKDLLANRSISNPLDQFHKIILNLLQALDFAHNLEVTHGFIEIGSIIKYEGRYCLRDFALPSQFTGLKRFDSELEPKKYTDIQKDLAQLAISLKEIFEFIAQEVEVQHKPLFQSTRNFLDQLLGDGVEKQFISANEAAQSFSQMLQEKSISPQILERTDDSVNSTSNKAISLPLEDVSDFMPLLAKTIKTCERDSFKEVILIHINHCAEDIFMLNKVFISLGATVVFVAIPYSDIALSSSLPYSVYHASSSHLGFNLFRNGEYFSKIEFAFEGAIKSLIIGAFNEAFSLASREKKKILIVEDGGYHYDLLDEIRKLGIDPTTLIIGAVEQTASGARRCAKYAHDHSLPYPVLSVARSDLKIRFEPFFIARRVADEINDLLYQVNEFLSFHNVVIFGYGIIGRNIASTVQQMSCCVFIVDTDPDIRNLAEEEGYEVLENIPPSIFENRSIFIGATGESSFSHSMLTSFLESKATILYLASASSKRIEFADVIEFFEGNYETRRRIIRVIPLLGKVKNIEIEFNQVGLTYHFDYEKDHKSILMIARGFPVNFFKPHKISLTHRIIDPINTEIVLCAQNIASYSTELQKQLYLLGAKDIPNFKINEEALISEWLGVNKLTKQKNSVSVWDEFRIHPLESKLRINFIKCEHI